MTIQQGKDGKHIAVIGVEQFWNPAGYVVQVLVSWGLEMFLD